MVTANIILSILPQNPVQHIITTATRNTTDLTPATVPTEPGVRGGSVSEE